METCPLIHLNRPFIGMASLSNAKVGLGDNDLRCTFDKMGKGVDLIVPARPRAIDKDQRRITLLGRHARAATYQQMIRRDG